VLNNNKLIAAEDEKVEENSVEKQFHISIAIKPEDRQKDEHLNSLHENQEGMLLKKQLHP